MTTIKKCISFNRVFKLTKTYSNNFLKFSFAWLDVTAKTLFASVVKTYIIILNSSMELLV